jgi:diaminohydroxyphosphoribosylaminopyrimidine deaminase/5-amino-6-(5-phosphoribosylamino)uracil reductase
VLTGIGTIRADDPQMNVRAVDTTRQPRRVVVDSRLELPLEAKVLNSPGGVVTLVHTREVPQREQELRDRGVHLLRIAANAEGKNDLPAMLRALADEGVNELHIEAGSKLNGSLIAAGLVDELLLYVAPKLLGPGEPLATLPALTSLGEAQQLRITQVQALGEDVRILARFTKKAS